VVNSCGSITIKAGTQHFRTIDLTGVTCNSGGAGGGGPPTSVWSASDAAANGFTLSNGGLTVTSPIFNVYGTVRGTVSRASGKVYIEFYTPTGAPHAPASDLAVGVADAGFVPTNYLGTSNYSAGTFTVNPGNYQSTGFLSNYTMTAIEPAAGDVLSIAIDLTAGKIWVAQNNVWFGSGDPSTGANPMWNITTPAAGLAYFPALTLHAPASGVWTLQSTAASQKYAPPAGFVAWDSATSGCPEATAYLARTVGGDEGGNAANVTTLICGLVTDGVWGKLDTFYLFAQQNATDAKLNLVGAIYNLPATTATFTQYKGYSAFPFPAFDTGLNLSLPGSKFYANAGSITAWMNDTPANGAEAPLGTNSTSGVTYTFPNYSGQFYCTINGTADFPIVSPGTAGLYGCDRMSADWMSYYHNGVNIATVAAGSHTSYPIDIFVGSMASGYPVSTTLSEVSIGAGLGDAGQAALSARMHTYMAAAGSECPEAVAYLARAPGETTHAADLIALICGLVTDGTWAKLDALYILAQQTQADARLNLVSASYPLVGTATFVPYQGFSLFATPALDTGFNPGTAVGAHLQPSDGFIGAWAYDAPDTLKLQMGASTSTGGIAISASYGLGDQYYCYIGYSNPPFNTPPNLPGFYSCDKGDVNNVVLYYNDAPSGPTQNQGTVAFPSANMYVGSAAVLAATQKTLSEVNFGASIGAVRQATLYARLRSYMTAVGVP
jgi:hypothetical protein